MTSTELPTGPQAIPRLSEVMSPSGSSAQPQLHHGATPSQSAQMEDASMVTRVVHTVTTVHRHGADVEAPDTPTSTASRKRTALSTDLVPGGDPKRSSSPTPSRDRPPLIPGQPAPWPLPLSSPAGSPMSVGPDMSPTATTVIQHSGDQLVSAGGSDATSAHRGQQSNALPIGEEEREAMRHMVRFY